ncbi:YdcF family protein [Dyadobacter sp. CY356]|uniref:YdcF family protein n=1 Tax=Dyadobacter sp. CY356 TaxID=2906442 RepID=UPI001F3CF0C4|nr:YdcF family protein [Dyadobacter sp. CY356]MCF0059040.1 YdcF family protein [Dyadobacter sp. CY356]
MPFSISLILILYGLMTKKARRKRIAVIFAFVILYLISNSFLINKAFNWWEYKPVNISEVKKTYDVGILLTGGMISTPDLTIDHPDFGPHADRFLQAYLLYKNGKIRKILITGASPKDFVDAGKSEVQQVSTLLIQWGVKPEDILLEPNAKNTRENAVYSEKILHSKFPGKSYILITSSFHLRRALACFKKAGVSADVFPTDFYGGTGSTKIKDMIIPDPEVVGYSQPLFREWVGIIIYKLMGYC